MSGGRKENVGSRWVIRMQLVMRMRIMAVVLVCARLFSGTAAWGRGECGGQGGEGAVC